MSEVNKSNQLAWSTTQAYSMAVVCLFLGLVMGYLVRSSAVALTDRGSAAAHGGTHASRPIRREQMAQIADEQAQPLVARLRKEPQNAVLLAQLGNVYYDAKDYSNAVRYYDRSLKVRPDNPNVRTDLGTCYFYMGDADRALREFDTALTYDPKHAQTMFNIGFVKWQAKMDATGAIAAWQKLLEVDPTYPQRAKVESLIAEVKKHQYLKF